MFFGPYAILLPLFILLEQLPDEIGSPIMNFVFEIYTEFFGKISEIANALNLW